MDFDLSGVESQVPLFLGGEGTELVKEESEETEGKKNGNQSWNIQCVIDYIFTSSLCTILILFFLISTTLFVEAYNSNYCRSRL